jgi:hypothetical protein
VNLYKFSEFKTSEIQSRQKYYLNVLFSPENQISGFNSATNPVVDINIYGYAGDGNVSLEDGGTTDQELVANTFFPVGNIGGKVVAIDVTEYVNRVLLQGAPWLGFKIEKQNSTQNSNPSAMFAQYSLAVGGALSTGLGDVGEVSDPNRLTASLVLKAGISIAADFEPGIGSELWTYKLDLPQIKSSASDRGSFAGSASNTVYRVERIFGSPLGGVYLVALQDGIEKWKLRLSEAETTWTSGIVVTDRGNILVDTTIGNSTISESYSVKSMNCISPQGEMLWKSYFTNQTTVYARPGAYKQSTWCLIGQNGEIFCLHKHGLAKVSEDDGLTILNMSSIVLIAKNFLIFEDLLCKVNN